MSKLLSLFTKYKSLFILEEQDGDLHLNFREYDEYIENIPTSLVKYLSPDNNYLKYITPVQNAIGITWFDVSEEESDRDIEVIQLGDYYVFILDGHYMIHVQHVDEEPLLLDDNDNIDSYIESLHKPEPAEYPSFFEETKKLIDMQDVDKTFAAFEKLEKNMSKEDYSKFQSEIDSLFGGVTKEMSEQLKEHGLDLVDELIPSRPTVDTTSTEDVVISDVVVSGDAIISDVPPEDAIISDVAASEEVSN